MKSKGGEGFGDPLEMVGVEKIRRIRRAAEAWLAAHPELAGLDARFDVMVERRGRMELVARAF